MTWTEVHAQLDPRTRRTSLWRDGVTASFLDAFAAMQDPEFCAFYSASLLSAPYHSFAWELPRLTRERLEEPYEHVVISSPGLADMHPDPTAFSEHFTTGPVACFTNLSGDATLIAPRPAAPHISYTHLADFLRNAPADVQHALWSTTATALLGRLDRPRWLSTAGLGVGWLHVRIDERPKYYRFAAYR